MYVYHCIGCKKKNSVNPMILKCQYPRFPECDRCGAVSRKIAECSVHKSKYFAEFNSTNSCPKCTTATVKTATQTLAEQRQRDYELKEQKRKENKAIFCKVDDDSFEDDSFEKTRQNYVIGYVHGFGQEHSGYCSGSTCESIVRSREIVIGITEISTDSFKESDHEYGLKNVIELETYGNVARAMKEMISFGCGRGSGYCGSTHTYEAKQIYLLLDHTYEDVVRFGKSKNWNTCSWHETEIKQKDEVYSDYC